MKELSSTSGPLRPGVLVFLAWRGLLSSPLSLCLLVLAVTGGIGLQIPVTANIEGYTQELIRAGVKRFSGHLVVMPRKAEYIEDADEAMKRLRALPFVTGAAARCAYPGVIFKGNRHVPARVVGLDPLDEDRVHGLCAGLESGRCLSADPAVKEVLLGARVADMMGLREGDRARIVLPYEDLGDLEFAKGKFRVAGILRGAGWFQFDRDVFVHGQTLRSMLDLGDVATGMSVFVDDQSRSVEYAALVEKTLGGVDVRPWWEVEDFVRSALAGNRALTAVSTAMVLLAVMIPVFALLYISVLHERRQVAILAALGFRRTAVFAAYLLRAALVGLSGACLGLGVAALLCSYFQANPLFEFGGFVVRPHLTLKVVLLPTAVIVLMTVLAGAAPAVKAALSNPSQELRED